MCREYIWCKKNVFTLSLFIYSIFLSGDFKLTTNKCSKIRVENSTQEKIHSILSRTLEQLNGLPFFCCNVSNTVDYRTIQDTSKILKKFCWFVWVLYYLDDETTVSVDTFAYDG